MTRLFFTLVALGTFLISMPGVSQDNATNHETQQPATSPKAAVDPVDVARHPCTGKTCSEHGRCVVTSGHPVCMCDAGYRNPPTTRLVCIAQGAAAGEASDPGQQRDPTFPWFSVAPLIGYGFWGEPVSCFSNYPSSISKGHSLNLRLHLDFGGLGLGFELVPLYRRTWAEFTSNNALGAELNIVYRMHFGQWYPQFGLGIHSAWLTSSTPIDEIDMGVEILGRLPIGVTWYMLDNVGFVAELGVMWGVVAFGSPSGEESEMCGHEAVDISLGIRLP